MTTQLVPKSFTLLFPIRFSSSLQTRSTLKTVRLHEIDLYIAVACGLILGEKGLVKSVTEMVKGDLRTIKVAIFAV